MNGIVLHVSHVVPGAVHDVTLLRASELLDEIPLASKLLADKAYIGEEPFFFFFTTRCCTNANAQPRAASRIEPCSTIRYNYSNHPNAK
jgi:hypothetical protein